VWKELLRGVTAYFAFLAQLPPEAWLRIGLANASLTKITIYDTGRVSVTAVGDCGHLPYAEVTFT
jgi:broad specificity phosphatase PhoE